MSSEVPFPPPGFDELSIDEQIEYVNKLGERIPSLPDDLSVSDPEMHTLKSDWLTTKKTAWKE